MDWQEQLLLRLSNEPTASLEGGGADVWTVDNALSLLESEFSNFGPLVTSRSVVDVGCGLGYQSIALVKKYRCSGVGVDSNVRLIEKANANAKRHSVSAGSLTFLDRLPNNQRFDIVISQNSFEHLDNPEQRLAEMRDLLNPNGKILLTFGPPWLAPYGSHMHFFCRVPWLNVLFSERAVMAVRARFRNDGAMRYEEVESGLNRMTVGRFEQLVGSARLLLESHVYRCVKGFDWLSSVPMVRELFINRVSVVLRRDEE